ncbi:hypothetical protein BDZ91DRAFT_730815 [Kalaharituber pfeilii]|nr:hypothetical protein BDZ91DRAFT_730815 [Kalaharituber pfeilii]
MCNSSSPPRAPSGSSWIVLASDVVCLCICMHRPPPLIIVRIAILETKASLVCGNFFPRHSDCAVVLRFNFD